MNQYIQIKDYKHSQEDMFVLVDDIIEYGSYLDEETNEQVYYVDLMTYEDFYFLTKEEYDSFVKRMKEYSF